MIKHNFKNSPNDEDVPMNVLQYINENIEYFREQDQINRREYFEEEINQTIDSKKQSKCVIQ